MARITLDQIAAAAEAKYGALEIPLSDDYTVRLLNPLRLSEEKRTALMQLQKALSDEGQSQEGLLSEALGLVAATPEQASRLLDALGGDLAMLVEVFTQYTEGTQAGEASASAS